MAPDDPHEPMRPAKDWHKPYVGEAFQLRGMLLGSYAHIEFMLADICLRAWEMPAYAHLAKQFPYSVETRIAEARAIFTSEGPFRQYANEAESLLVDLLQYQEIRHFMAHGLMTIKFTDTAVSEIEFRLFRPTKSGPEIGFIHWSFEGMRETAQQIAEYGSQWTRFLYRVHMEQGFAGKPGETT